MDFFQVFFPITVLLCLIESREYHYNKPALPFYEKSAPHELQTPASLGVNLPNVIRTSGPNPKNYEIYDFKSSQQVFNAIPQPAAYHSASALSVNYNQAPISNTIHQSVQPQPGYSNAQTYPSLTQSYVAGTQYAPIYRSQGSKQAVSFDVQASQSYVLNPFNGEIIKYAQSTPQYRAPSAPLISVQQSPSVDLTSVPTPGNYVSQSEAGHLDIYTHKQQGGNDRTYKRTITICYSNGQCERLQLNAGPTDSTQNNVVWSTRTYTAPVKNKCQKIAEAKHKAAASQSVVTVPVLIRPPNRRLFPYSEIVLPRDPYN